MSEENHDQKPKVGPATTASPAPPDDGGGKKTVGKKIISVVTSALGLGYDGPVVKPSDIATNLAMDRNYLAAERTLMAWIRTALSMISFGFTIGKLGQVVSSVDVKGFMGHTRMIGVESIAYFLVILGTLALTMATLQHRVRVRELIEMGLRRQVSTSFIVAVLLIVVGGFALSSLVMAL